MLFISTALVEKTEDWAYSSSRHYYKGVSDPLVDEYGGPSKGGIKVEIDLGDEEFFEEGNVIGSAFFRFQFAERAKTH
jgi:hypothetical protein